MVYDRYLNERQAGHLLHSWAQTSEWPTYDYDSTLLLGPETEEQYVDAVDYELCNAVLQDIVDWIDTTGLL